ncbi:putative RLL motif containing protein 1 [Blattamonas nauphoetae]|uniref:RLL motif containing protein 1 n=1 Tax=Blattamonas nauphoetae TaxID=2049346 RepID=A0ABQ9YFD3_9EUKA|nr:putative RLL motif containing protein 1 [Blattamonas nauphoetae]
MTTHLLQRHLGFLGYASPIPEGELDNETLYKVISWLENTYIQQLAQNPIENFYEYTATWKKTILCPYVTSLGFTDVNNGTSNKSIVIFVAQLAMDLLYKQKKEEIAAHVQRTEDGKPKKDSIPLDLLDSLNLLAQATSQPLLRPDTSPDGVMAFLADTLDIVSGNADSLSGPVESAPQMQAIKAAIRSECEETIRMYEQMKKGEMPVGMDLGALKFDSNEKTAAIVLRMLYQKQLREMQTTINNVLSDLQQHTANPKTDLALGRVGK